MELESEEGWKIPIKEESKFELGRGINFPTDDRTVSRRHVLFQLQNYPKEDIRDAENVVFFKVVGKNPIWVCSGCKGQKRVFRNSEKGELRVGDRLSISLKRPVFFTLKKKAHGDDEELEEEAVLKAVERRKKRTVERTLEEEKGISLKMEDFCDTNDDEEDEVRDSDIRSLDISHFDPVKEFGFLPVGQEFKQYPKQRICEIKDWDWFLEESSENIEDDEMADEEISRGRTWGRGKKKKGNHNNDEDWTGESEDEKVLITKLRSAKRPKYSKTRSKYRQKHNRDTLVGNSMSPKTKSIGKYAGNEDAESLGGFIVDNDEEEEDPEDDINDEEEEFEDDDDE